MKRPLDRNISNMLTALRLPLAFLIVAGHANILISPIMKSDVMIQYDYTIIKYYIHLISQVLFTPAVPLFFIISGFLFFYGLDSFDLIRFWGKLQKRIITLLIPYLIWNVIYWIEPIMSMFMKGKEIDFLWLIESLWVMPNQLPLIKSMSLTTPADPPLWFVRDLMVCMISSPLIYRLMRIKCIGLFSLIVFGLMWYLGEFQYPFPGISICSLFFFSFGCFLAINRVNISSYMNSKLAFILVVSLFLLVVVMESLTFDYVKDVASLKLVHNHYIFASCKVLGCMAYPMIIYRLLKNKEFSDKYLGGAFCVFAVHWLILDILKIIFSRVISAHISQSEAFGLYFLLIFAGFFGSLLFYYIIKKNRKLLMLLAGGR